MEPLRTLSPIEEPVGPSRSLGPGWIFAGILLLLVALAAGTGSLSIATQPDWRTVDVADLPEGTVIKVVDSASGPATLARCPGLLGRDGPVPSWCAASDPAAARTAVIAGAVAVAALLGAVLALRRWWSVRRARRRPQIWPPTAYRQEGMPGTFWLAMALVGALTALIDVVVVASFSGDGGIGAARGGVFWTAVLVAIGWRYGWCRASGLEVEGEDLVWTAPLRTRRVRSADVAGLTRRSEGMLGERAVELQLVDGTGLPVAVPNLRHERLLQAFLSTLPGGTEPTPVMPPRGR